MTSIPTDASVLTTGQGTIASKVCKNVGGVYYIEMAKLVQFGHIRYNAYPQIQRSVLQYTYKNSILVSISENSD